MFQEVECMFAEIGLDNPDCKSCFCRSDEFNFMTDSELEQVTRNKFQVNYKAGEIIFKQGTQSTHCISFTHGIAKVYDEDRHGEIILKLIKPTEFITGYGMLFDNVHDYSVTAITDSSVCFVDFQLIEGIFNNNKHFRKAFFTKIQQHNYFIQSRIISLLNKKNPGRIAGTLLYLARDFYNSDSFILHLSRKELTFLSVVSFGSLSRILNQFHEAELIRINGKKINILNPVMLEKIWLNG